VTPRKDLLSSVTGADGILKAVEVNLSHVEAGDMGLSRESRDELLDPAAWSGVLKRSPKL
jgi:hypothetical protein